MNRREYSFDNEVLLAIKRAQDERGWSDYMLAKMTKVPEATTRSSRKNNSTPLTRTLVDYAIGMGLPPYEFFPKSEELYSQLCARDRRMMIWWYSLPEEEKDLFDKTVNFHHVD